MDEKSLLGRKFFSLEEFISFFDEFCQQTKALFFVKNSTPLSKCKWASDPTTSDVVVALKYSSLRLACIEVKANQRTDGNRKESQIVGCKAYLVLRISEQKKCLVITDCCLSHNHALCPIEFAYYFKKGYLYNNSCLSTRTTNNISKQFICGEDIRRLLCYCKTGDNGIFETLHSLDALFTNDPGAKVKLVFVDNQVVIKTFFFLTSIMRSLCQRYPMMLVFDRMVSVNGEFELYTVLCIDDEGQGHACAYCLTRKVPDLLRFTLVSFVQSVPEVKFKVACLVLGAEVEDHAVVKELLPHAKVQICRSQVEHLLFRKAQEMGSPDNEIIWPLFLELTSANSEIAYMQAVKNLNATLPKDFMTYFWKHWHSCQEMWVNCWAFKRTKEVDCGKLILQQQQKLAVSLRSSTTIAECILDLVHMHRPKEEHESLTEDEVITRYHAICKPEPASLIEEELGFAGLVTYAIMETKDGFILNDGVSEFCMNHSLTSCSCTIHTSSLLPCRHLFATRLRNKNPLFDLKLLKNNSDALIPVHKRCGIDEEDFKLL
ncbi:uncharacterized protein ZSWIM9-like [Ambystoma mexicanum]|uniref:uncharacterized protein ZSWIM9-like n=1 Tax=Ambystoma mexicanum TaxID=8296 RepID=UPI0037E703BC